MIEFILPDPPTKFAKMVKMHSSNDFANFRANCGHYHHGRDYNCLPSRMVPSKSYTLGAYPRNVIGMKDLEIK